MADTDEPGTARRNPENGSVAMRMGPRVAACEYFVIHPDHGGHYTDGVPENVAEWPRLADEPAR